MHSNINIYTVKQLQNNTFKKELVIRSEWTRAANRDRQ